MKKKLLTALLALVLLVCVLPLAAAAEGEGGGTECAHNWVHVPGKEPTCTEPGLTAGEQCSLCFVWSYPQEPRAALNHYIVQTEAKAPTCTEDGYGLGEACSRCGTVTRAAPVIPKLEHSLVHVDGTAATCSVPGLSDGEQCTVCQYWSIPQREVTVPHTPKAVAGVEQTCSEKGWTEGSECAVCGVTLQERTEIPAHFPVRVPGKASTCTATGLTDGTKCSQCSVILVEQQPIGVVSCNWVHVPGKNPTCTEEGRADAEVCSMCKTVNQGGQTLPSLGGHTPDAGVVTTAATCHSAGVKTYTCTTCKQTTKTEPIPATGKHVFATTKDKTHHYMYCTNAGCKLCYSDPHTYGRWKVVRTATPQKKGVLKKTCLNCDHALWSNYEYSDNPPTNDYVMVPLALMMTTGTALAVLVTERKRRHT